MPGWLHTLDETQFGVELYRMLSPSRVIKSVELLRGRAEQLEEIRRALYSPGRHVFIHGYRGVGKSSLAETAAVQTQSSDNHHITLEAGPFFKTIQALGEAALSTVDPRQIKSVVEKSGGIGWGGISGKLKQEIEIGRVPLPTSLNEAVAICRFIPGIHSETPVVILDEFDLLKDIDEHKLYANFIKFIGDQGINIKFIFCGIAESIDELFVAHPSIHRYFHSVKLDRLTFDPRLEIIDESSSYLGIRIDDTTRYRIALNSDGFPHYVHLICEKLYWKIYEHKNSAEATADDYQSALLSAIDSMEPQLRVPYEKATRKYTNDYEPILWAAADTHQMQRPSREIYDSYLIVMKQLGLEPLERSKFDSRINNLKQDRYAAILRGTRAGWYEYSQKVLRGFARMRADQSGVELSHDHPMGTRK